MLDLLVIFLGLAVLFNYAAAYKTGFWYGATRSPIYQYDSVPYANLTMRILLPYEDGPGQNLVTDPVNPGAPLFVGNTINLQTFHTQFILDLSYALDIGTERIYVLSVQRGRVHYTWESTSVIVNFIFLERNNTQDLTLLEAVAELTNQMQLNTSRVYIGTNVTNYADAQYGLQVVTWDMSLKLGYSIDVVGGPDVRDGYYLDQGSLGICGEAGALNYTTYCEFERFFEDDLSRALNISYYRVNILFVKSSSLDSVLVYFRVQPPPIGSKEDNVTTVMANLISQVADPDSMLYQGNVTLRVDPTWGVSQILGTPRKATPLFTLRHYEYDASRLRHPERSSQVTAYDRCKANLRCNWGVVELDQYTNDARYFQRLFDRGQLYGAQLFLDFEDWRMGIRGLSWANTLPPTAIGQTSLTKARSDVGALTGAHVWPFDFPSLGPTIPAYLTEYNEGLVLDRGIHIEQVLQQQALVADLQGRVDWLADNIEVAAMGPELRSRYDVRANLSAVQADFNRWLVNERAELDLLMSSQCARSTAQMGLDAVYDLGCYLQFNTSSLKLTGTINGTGSIAYTSQGTEVAVFAFNSIYLGPEVKVNVVGQRALVLVSKTSAVINTTIEVTPGTLGGFPGGGSVARLKKDRLSDSPDGVYICDLGFYCDTTSARNRNITGLNNRGEVLITNNVNGPGSGNVRVQAFVLNTDATAIPEIQQIGTTAHGGQTVAGGFVVKFGQYSTPIIPADVSPLLLREILQDNLNIVSPASYPIVGDRSHPATKAAGIGRIAVTRSDRDDQLGYTWNVTFVSAIGNVPQLQVESYLFGEGSRAWTKTIQEGNELGGGFQLTFLGETTELIPPTASAEELAAKLTALPSIESAYVLRTDPTDNCGDGFCDNGPTQAHGLQWTIYTTSLVDNVSPTSPTSPVARQQAPPNLIEVKYSETLTGDGAYANISRGTSTSYYSPQSLLNVEFPFSLAYGGAGGSYGGKGGSGFGMNSVGRVYNDQKISDLIGGSGGQMSPADLFTINAALGPSVSGAGGAGGGAVEIIAANDLIIGSYGVITVQGEIGESTSTGGGGGGSGGAILLSAGTTAIVQGILDASGGPGGYGGTSSAFQGGGGGGGRIAIFADSITVSDAAASLRADGGNCGIYTAGVDDIVASFNISVNVAVPLGLKNRQRIGELVREQLQIIFPQALNTLVLDIVVGNTSVRVPMRPGFKVPGLELQVQLVVTLPVSLFSPSGNSLGPAESLSDYNGTVIQRMALRVQQSLHAALDRTRNDPGDRFLRNTLTRDTVRTVTTATVASTPNVMNLDVSKVLILDLNMTSFNLSSITLVRSTQPVPCTNVGSAGTIYTQSITTTQAAAVLAYPGAEFTNRALFLSNNESTVTPSGTTMEAPFTGNGPTIAFAASRPTRVTYYVRIAGGASVQNTDASKADYGSLFTLISRGEAGLNVSNVIGVFFGGNGLMVGSNFESNVDEATYLKRQVTIDPYPNTQKWYKIDLRIDWNLKTYRVLLNDTLMVQDLPFDAQDVDGVRLSLFRSVQVFYDEIFVGSDATLGFTCPAVSRKGTTTSAPPQKGWNYDDVHAGQGLATYKTMTRHYNFLSTTGSIPFDGQGQLQAFQDVYTSEPDGDYAASDTLNKVYAGALSYFTGGDRTTKDFVTASQTLASPTGLWTLGQGNPGDGRQFWYTQFNYNSSDPLATPSLSPYLVGGVAACSTSDLVNWRFEGFAFQYTNLTDLVHVPVKNRARNAGGGSDYIVVRPKVLYNAQDKMYVMWAAMDYSDANPRSASETLAMTMVATSPYEDGPFQFRRSFYPDGNQTLDQVPFYNNDGVPVLARTYFLTVEYILPQAMMQPVWESAKDQSGTINYRANYHRATYDPAYDNFNDIYLQRWRLEDAPYNVICEDRLTGTQRVVPQGVYNDDGFVCDFPRERKIILGQGNPEITSRFVSPNDSANSWWRPTSVPAVKAQDWSANYRDGYCGIRSLNDGYSLFDERLDDFEPTDRGTCSNIADNPVMETPQDKLIGVLEVVLTRRTKFLAMSRLTDDLLDTDGRLSSFEGALDSGYLLSLISQLGQFSFTAGPNINSTFRAPQRTEFDTAADYKIRFSQYVRNINDRALYSLACVLDGVCPVNFKDQLKL